MFGKAYIIVIALVGVVCFSSGSVAAQRVQQPREVIEAYRVCTEFQRLFAEDLDFDRAFEATFTKDPRRRREIAIAESELGHIAGLNQIDDATLIGIYKSQSQLLFPLLLLIDVESQIERAVLLPPNIDAIYDRVRVKVKDAQALRDYAAQLDRDVAEVRSHFNQLVTKYPSFALRVREFKKAFLQELKPPDEYVVKPLTAYSKGRVLGLKEEYYQIKEYSVIREGGEMKIVGLRFFSLF
jgi:hypothetical protein